MFKLKLALIRARLAAAGKWLDRMEAREPHPPGQALEGLVLILAAAAVVCPGSGDWPPRAWAFVALAAFLAGRAVYLRECEEQWLDDRIAMKKRVEAAALAARTPAADPAPGATP